MEEKVLLFQMPDEKIQEAYKKLLADIDQAVMELITGRFAGSLECRPGCSSCCQSFSVFPLEFAMIIMQNTNINANVNQGGADNNECTLLHHDLCTVYETRPVICRTQGIPLGYIDHFTDSIEVSACHLSFPEDRVIEFEDILMMEEFNLRLADLNSEYCRENGISPEIRIELKQLSWR